MGLMKKLTSAVVASSLVLGAVSTAFAAPAADEVNTAYARLNHYNVVQGVALPDGTVTPALDQDITRAQLITIVTRAFGQEENAKLLTGATTGYGDVDGNEAVKWATGYIFMGQRIADQKGIKIGRPGNLFAPSENVSQIEALAFIMKYLGIEVGTGDTWVEDTIANAKAAGLVTDAEVAKYLDNANAKANRGHVFALLDGIFASYNKLEGGKTVYTAYVDTNAPELHVSEPTLTTDKPTLTLTGHVKGEFSGLFLGSEKITANEDGTFSVEVPLEVGANAITVTAVDLAGNSDEATFTVTRNAGVAAKITASLAASVVAGSATDLTFEVTDANGVALEVPASDLSVTVGGSIGTYADGKFTAGEKVGTGTVTVAYGDLTPVTVDVTVAAGELAQLNVSSASVDKGDTVQLTAADKFGNAITSGVTYTWEGTGIAVTNSGLVFTAESGKYTVTAKSGEATATATIGVFAEAKSVAVSAPESITANNATRKAVTFSVADEHGNTVGSYEKRIDLTGTGVTFYADATSTTPITYVTTEAGLATVYAKVSEAMGGETLTISAVANDNANIKGSATLNAVIPVATSLKVTSAPKFIAANYSTTETVEVAVVDQDGEAVNDVYPVTATIAGPAALVSETGTYVNGTAAEFDIKNAEFIGTEGTVTVTFTVDGIGSTTASVQSVIAGNPAKLGVTVDKSTLAAKAATPFTFTVEVQDRNGVPVALSTGPVNLTVSLPTDIRTAFEIDGTGPDANGEVTVELAAGEKTGTFELQVVGKFTGNVSVAVKGEAAGLKVSGTQTVSVTPGEVEKVVLDRDGDVINASVANPTATFTASLADFFNNEIAKSDVEFTVYAENAGGSATNVTVNGQTAASATPITVKTDATGNATIELAARPYANETYTVTVGYEGTTSSATVNVENAVVASLSTKLYKMVNGVFTSATTVNAGEEYWMVVTAKDNYGGPMTGIAGDLVLVAPKATVGSDDAGTLYATDAAVEAVPFTAHTGAPSGLTMNAGDYFVQLYGGKAGVIAVGAKYGNLQTAVSKTSNISVKAGDIAGLTVNGGEAIEATGAGKVHGAYSISIADAFGNTKALTHNATVTVTNVDKVVGLSTEAAGSRLTFRKDASGATVTTFTTRSTTSFYVVATETGTYQVDFTLTVDLDGNGSISGDETFTVDNFEVKINQ